MLVATRRALTALAVCSLAVTTAACSSASRDESGAIASEGSLDVMEVRVGDCFDDPDDLPEDGSMGETADVGAKPCSQPHDNEVYHSFDLEGEEYPGDEAVEELAFDGCEAAFEPFVGTPYEDSELDIFTLTPLEDGWEQLDDRTVICALFDLSGEQVTGSLEGSAR
jgi:hypothetical protein